MENISHRKLILYSVVTGNTDMTECMTDYENTDSTIDWQSEVFYQLLPDCFPCKLGAERSRFPDTCSLKVWGALQNPPVICDLYIVTKANL